jgi:hypothetical protein
MREKSVDDHIRRTIFLRSLLPRLKAETEKMAKEISAYEKLRQQTAEQKRLVASAQQNLQWQKHSLDQMVKSRQGLLKKTAAEKEAMARQLKLWRAKQDLRQLWSASPAFLGQKVAKPSSVASPAALRPGKNAGQRQSYSRIWRQGRFRLESRCNNLARRRTRGAPQSGRFFCRPSGVMGRSSFCSIPRLSQLMADSPHDADMGQNVGAGEPLAFRVARQDRALFRWRKGNDPIDPMAGRNNVYIIPREEVVDVQRPRLSIVPTRKSRAFNLVQDLKASTATFSRKGLGFSS